MWPSRLSCIHPFQACRSRRLNWWQLRPIPWGPLSLIALFGLHWLAIEYAPPARLLGTAPLTRADWIVLVFGVLWPAAAVPEAFEAWGRYTSLGLPLPTAATPDGPPVARTGEEH